MERAAARRGEVFRGREVIARSSRDLAHHSTRLPSGSSTRLSRTAGLEAEGFNAWFFIFEKKSSSTWVRISPRVGKSKIA
jgi:hypothetical protein